MILGRSMRYIGERGIAKVEDICKTQTSELVLRHCWSKRLSLNMSLKHQITSVRHVICEGKRDQ